MDKSITLRVVDLDDCPETDNPIIKGQCSDCDYYKGFQMANGQPCIKCSC